MSTDAMSDDTPTRPRKSGGARSSPARRGRRGARDEGLAIASAAKERALDAASSAADRIEDEVERRKERETDRLSRIADAIEEAGDALEDELRPVAGLVYRASDEMQTLADSVRERDARELIGSAQDFVQRRPLAFAAMTGLLGFAAVRLLTPIPGQGTEDDDRYDDYDDDDDDDHDDDHEDDTGHRGDADDEDGGHEDADGDGDEEDVGPIGRPPAPLRLREPGRLGRSRRRRARGSGLRSGRDRAGRGGGRAERVPRRGRFARRPGRVVRRRERGRVSAPDAGSRAGRGTSSGRAPSARRRTGPTARGRSARGRDSTGGPRGVADLLGASVAEAVALTRAEMRVARAELADGVATVSRVLAMLAAALMLALASCVLLLIALTALLAALGLPIWFAALTATFFGFLAARACVQLARGASRPLFPRSRAGVRADVRSLRAAFGEGIGRPAA